MLRTEEGKEAERRLDSLELHNMHHKSENGIPVLNIFYRRHHLPPLIRKNQNRSQSKNIKWMAVGGLGLAPGRWGGGG